MNKIQKLIAGIVGIDGCKFASFVYKAKSSGEVARYTVLVGFKYSTLVEKSIIELAERIKSGEFAGDMLVAAEELMASLLKSKAAHDADTQNEDYTKKGLYIPVGNGLNINKNDGTLAMFGLIHSKVVITPGEHKNVKSAQKTINKAKIDKSLPRGKFQEFAFDEGNIGTVKMNGETIEIENLVTA